MEIGMQAYFDTHHGPKWNSCHPSNWPKWHILYDTALELQLLQQLQALGSRFAKLKAASASASAPNYQTTYRIQAQAQCKMRRGCKTSASDMHLADKNLISTAPAMKLITKANNKAGSNLWLVLKP